ncbi:hypothetical protein BASA82_000460 [Batrachochytrium salamandrivorans]|nr:hypothetical protein BASA82_000460 [Batrachochytrium salamandrivorans]
MTGLMRLNRFRKLISAEDAARKVHDNDTITGLGRLAERPGMIARVVGSHYGQIPPLAKRVIANEIPGFALPLGAISKMIRSAASNTPFHVSQVGLGTFVDPRVRDSAHQCGANSSHYAADLNGNLTLERESILGDTRLQANAAKAAGGIVIAQVSRLALENTLNARSVHIAGSLVDYIVHVPEQPQSFFTGYNAARSGEIRVPPSNVDEMEETAEDRLIIARRAALELELNNIVNLGIGMPRAWPRLSLWVVFEKGGLVKTFQQTCGMEVTFNGRNALRNGQNVLYISERAVFSLNYRGTLKLEEIAPGYDFAA